MYLRGWSISDIVVFWACMTCSYKSCYCVVMLLSIDVVSADWSRSVHRILPYSIFNTKNIVLKACHDLWNQLNLSRKFTISVFNKYPYLFFFNKNEFLSLIWKSTYTYRIIFQNVRYVSLNLNDRHYWNEVKFCPLKSI